MWNDDGPRVSCVGVVLATGDYPRSSTRLEGCTLICNSAKRRRSAPPGAHAYESVEHLAGRLGTNALTYRIDIAAASS